MPAAEPAVTAAAQAPTAETLERLSRLDAHGQPVLSVYIDLDPARFPTPSARASQLGSLLDESRRQAGDREARRVEALLAAEPAIARGALGLAIFSSERAGLLEAVLLSGPVEPLAVVDTIPWLEPVAATIAPGGWGVAVVSRRAARLFRGAPAGMAQFAAVTHELHRRHAQGGWSQARFQRGIEEQVAIHVHAVAERLLRAHRRSPFSHLVIVCTSELRSVVEHSLHSELRALLAGAVEADLEHAPVDQIAAAVAPVVERAEGERELDLISRLEQALGTGGPAAAGLDEVLSTLEERRVAVLLVPERGDLQAGLCPTCGRVSTDGARSCPLDEALLAEVDAMEYAVQEAASQSAQVMVARQRPQWLRDHGEIAALLRW